ncbi:hypothetical protein [Flavisphingomonas formosensis]|uniref:hypothetical protein n=1 Tax=Flavisphingomonas formosensis TaxID=861534 RepID=UPI0018E04A0C|nr:hypothetical protein [Sphingomonas formosensis]
MLVFVTFLLTLVRNCGLYPSERISPRRPVPHCRSKRTIPAVAAFRGAESLHSLTARKMGWSKA